MMNGFSKLIRGDETRKTRFHTANGYLCLRPTEILRAFSSTALRLGARRYSPAPWLVYSATSHIAPLVSGKRVFEFGSGMSTLWFAQKCREVISAEDNPEWFSLIEGRTKGMGNVRVMYAKTKAEYLASPAVAGGRFDVVLIDGSYRTDCVAIVRGFLNPSGMVIVDNTDVSPTLSDSIRQEFPDCEVRAFRGWVPGNLHPNETTVITNIPVD